MCDSQSARPRNASSTQGEARVRWSGVEMMSYSMEALELVIFSF